MKKEYLSIFIKAIFAGLSIGLGSLLFVICSSKNLTLLGSFVFGIGLLLVCVFNLYLYTGKIGFLNSTNEKKQYIKMLGLTYIGNLIGIVALGYLMFFFFNKNNDVISAAINAAAKRDLLKEGSEFVDALRTFVGSIFCGTLVYVAVFGFKQDIPVFAKIVILLFAVFAFVASGFEHCIANMFYISMANKWNVGTLLNILIVTLGNSLGALGLNRLVIWSKK